MNTESKIIIAEVEKIVEAVCKADSNVFGYGIWTHHIKEVVRISKEIAEQLGADKEIVEISALLHDYAGIKDYSLHKEHHKHGAMEAGKILTRLNCTADKINLIKYCIANHRGSVSGDRNTPEVKCLASADAIAHIENVPSLFYLAFEKFHMEIDEGREWISNKLKRSWKKISPEVAHLIEEKYKAALTLLEDK